ncbi:cGMP-dependent protein kinase 2 (cGK 2) (cGK2) (cGMP-dependent protein kinase II) (cGKII) [Durusdinium trenchii]|uniref:cGMP-dependent protein kinase 2 (CGK 2) (CGK2) (cGMP-dependent protein kinase II) (cGKII) n=1 Tax=Durusdinium trenchii TaxID=1381693 RepID=A0ABP0S1T3_9DINO
MEYCSGGNLLRRIQQRHLCGIGSYRAPSTAIAWIAQVFLGLEHMHLRMDTLLRDLKPDNVVLSISGVAKLTDFGFGRFGVESTSGLWSFGVPAGSPGYVAPEVILQQNYDYSADLYSLGVLTWVLLSGGLVNVEPPQPPTGQRRTVNDFRAHAQDCDLLLRCLEDPRSNGALRLRRHEQDFVAKLIDRRPERRLSHRALAGSKGGKKA